MVPICENFNSFTQGWFVPSWVGIGRVVFYILSIGFFSYYLPLENGYALYLNKQNTKKTQLEFPSPKNALCQVRLILAQWFWRLKSAWNWPSGSVHSRFLKIVYEFSLFRYYLSLERVRSFIWTNLNPPHPRMVLQSFIEIVFL